MQTFDVAVIGYGPVGATLANLLGRQGLSVVVLEREGSIFHQPRAGHFDGEVMRVFQGIGLAGEIAAQTLVNPGMQFVTANGELLLDWPRPQTLGPEGWYPSYRFHQPFLERSLRAAVARQNRVEVALRSEVLGLERTAERVTVRYENLEGGEICNVAARYVVGCDGARSTVKEFIGTSLEDLRSHERWLVIDVKLHRPRPDLPSKTIQWCDPERPLTMANGIEGRRRWEIMLLPGEDAAEMTKPEVYWQLLSRWIVPAEAVVERAVVYTFHSVIAESWREGRLLLAGDACHQTPPFMGQGMCAGIRDVANLAWKLAAVIQGRAAQSLLNSYQTERAPHVREFIETAVRLGAMVHVTDLAAAAARDARFKSHPPNMKTPAPPLGPGLHGTSPPPAGTRAAQPTLDDGRRLDDVQGFAFGVLCNAALSAPVRADPLLRETVVIDDQHAQVHAYLQALGVAAVVIRPDRYILGIANTLAELRGVASKIPLSGRLNS